MRPAIDAVLTTWPPSRWAIMRGRKASSPWITPQRLTPRVHSQSRCVAVSSPPQIATPALLQSTWTRPSVENARSARAWTWARSLTSVRTPIARPPRASMRLTVSLRPVSSTSATTRAAPSAARLSARARPMPLAAPVTTPTRPLNDSTAVSLCFRNYAEALPSSSGRSTVSRRSMSAGLRRKAANPASSALSKVAGLMSPVNATMGTPAATGCCRRRVANSKPWMPRRRRSRRTTVGRVRTASSRPFSPDSVIRTRASGNSAVRYSPRAWRVSVSSSTTRMTAIGPSVPCRPCGIRCLGSGGKPIRPEPGRLPAGATQRRDDARRMPPVAPADVLHSDGEKAIGHARQDTGREAQRREIGVDHGGDGFFLRGSQRPAERRERDESLGHRRIDAVHERAGPADHDEAVPETPPLQEHARKRRRRLLPEPADREHGRAVDGQRQTGRLDPAVLGFGCFGLDAEQDDAIGKRANQVHRARHVRHERPIIDDVVVRRKDGDRHVTGQVFDPHHGIHDGRERSLVTRLLDQAAGGKIRRKRSEVRAVLIRHDGNLAVWPDQ